jgi:hypothetical protein
MLHGHLLPLADISPLWAIAAPILTASAGLAGVYLGFRLSSSRAFRERFAAAVATERSLLEKKSDELNQEFFYWHKDSVARLAMHTSAMSRKYPKPWRKEVEPIWKEYELTNVKIWEEFVLGGICRTELLKRLDNLYCALS